MMKVDFSVQTSGSAAVQEDDSLTAVREAYNKAAAAFPPGWAPAIIEVRIIAQQRTTDGT